MNLVIYRSFKGVFSVLVLSVLFFSFACQKSNTGKEILARVDKIKITREDFNSRLNNFLMYTHQDNREIHEQLLENMIDEKVMIFHAYSLGLDTTEQFNLTREKIEKDAILEAYRDFEAENRIQITEKEIQQAFSLSKEQVRARMLRASSKEEADLLYQQLKNGASFEGLAKSTFQDPRLANTGGDIGYFSWEDMDLPLAEAAQDLKINEISKPVLTRSGWFIIQVLDRFNPPYSESDYQNSYKNTKWIVTHRKKADAIRKYTAELLEDIQIDYHDDIVSVLIHDAPQNDSQSIESYLKPTDIIATVNAQPVTVEAFMDKARITSFRQRNSVKDINSFKRFFEGLIVRDVLLQKAYQKNIHKKNGVKSRIQKNIDFYFINEMKASIVDTVHITDREAREVFNKDPRNYFWPREANLREILVSSQEEAENIIQEIKQGEDFSSLAKKYSLRKWSAEQGGNLGYCMKSQFGDHGDAVFNLKPGEISTPLKHQGYYSIIQMINILPVKYKEFAEAKDEIKAQLLEEKKRIVLLNTVKSWREQVSIEYNLNNLTKDEVRRDI